MRIKADDRSGLERLLRYCARPVFALERLRQIDSEHLVYESIKPGSGGRVSLLLTPLEPIERLAALIPPACRHRHRYTGVLAPNAPLRAAGRQTARDWLEQAKNADAAGTPERTTPTPTSNRKPLLPHPAWAKTGTVSPAKP